jgi:hypothetical protein
MIQRVSHDRRARGTDDRDLDAKPLAVTHRIDARRLLRQDTLPDVLDQTRVIETPVAERGREHPGLVAAPRRAVG